jgi:hypothetical protein
MPWKRSSTHVRWKKALKRLMGIGECNHAAPCPWPSGLIAAASFACHSHDRPTDRDRSQGGRARGCLVAELVEGRREEQRPALQPVQLRPQLRSRASAED